MVNRRVGPAAAQQREISLHGHVMIQSNRCDRNHCQNRRGNARGDHPCGKRAIYQSRYSRPAREKRIAPKTDCCQMITVNRTPDDLGNHVICRAESDGAEPEKQKVVSVPPAYCGLQNALSGDNRASIVRPHTATGTRNSRANTIG